MICHGQLAVHMITIILMIVTDRAEQTHTALSCGVNDVSVMRSIAVYVSRWCQQASKVLLLLLYYLYNVNFNCAYIKLPRLGTLKTEGKRGGKEFIINSSFSSFLTDMSTTLFGYRCEREMASLKRFYGHMYVTCNRSLTFSWRIIVSLHNMYVHSDTSTYQERD
jgi:hypothetical protein